MATEYTTTGTLQLRRQLHPAGSPITITDAAEAARLVAVGAIVPRTSSAAAGPTVFDASAPVRTLLPQIKDATDAALLDALRTAELARVEGARSSIISAIDERLELLTAPPSDEEPDA